MADGAFGPEFEERPTGWLVEDAYRLAAVPLVAAALCGTLGHAGLAGAGLLLALFVGYFFRNPERTIGGDENAVVAPADGRVVEVAEVRGEDGVERTRIGIFLSIFDVHVNRAPVAGRVVSIERAGSDFLAAFDRQAPERNVRCSMLLEMPSGVRVRVTQITGLVARRIVCHPRLGEVLRRGDRFGLIRFGSRTDVLLPSDAEIRVVRGDRVRGGRSVLAVLRSDT